MGISFVTLACWDLDRVLTHHRRDIAVGGAVEHRIVAFPNATEVLSKFPEFEAFCVALGDVGIYILGGFIRDVWLGKDTFADIDMAVGTSREIITKSVQLNFPPDTIEKNAFGHLRVKSANLEIDVWPIQDSWYFQNRERYSDDPLHLLDSTFSSLDAIYYDVRAGNVVIGKGFDDVFKYGVLEYDLSKSYNPDKALNKLVRQIQQYPVRQVNIKRSEDDRSDEG